MGGSLGAALARDVPESATQEDQEGHLPTCDGSDSGLAGLAGFERRAILGHQDRLGFLSGFELI
jgi:hypothetical protein